MSKPFSSEEYKVGATIRVPASEYERRTRKQLDAEELTEEGIKSMRAADPFMYYSVPGLRRAALLLEDVDYADTAALCRGDRTCQAARRNSAPAGCSAPKAPLKTSIERRTSISTEVHPSLLLDDLLEQLDMEEFAGHELMDVDTTQSQ